jgi:2-keto-4-pentenoate hydratase
MSEATVQDRWIALAEKLHEARKTSALLEIPPREDLPGDAADSYRVQDLLIAAMDAPPIAWKLGAPTKGAQHALNLAEPFSGPVLPGMLVPSPARLEVAGYACHVFEPEIAITLGHDIDRAIDTREAAAAIASLHPAIEVIGFRFRNGRTLDALGMITDYGANGALVLGAAAPSGLEDYAALPLEVRINGLKVADRTPPPPETNPAELLAWFSGHLTARGHRLRKGDVITTGSQAGVIDYRPGDLVEADFGPAGVASVQF